LKESSLKMLCRTGQVSSGDWLNGNFSADPAVVKAFAVIMIQGMVWLALHDETIIMQIYTIPG
jgi:hypothetical protein